MTRGEARWNHLANLLVGGTGLVYGWMRYFVRPDEDDFTLAVNVNHRLQPSLEHWHILAAPLLIFTVALVWKSHVWVRVRLGLPKRRRTGLFLLALFFPMVASGYLLQTAVDQGWRQVWVITHVVTSCLWILGYCVHLLTKAPREGAGETAG